MRWCKCIDVVGPLVMWPHLIDEIKEFVEKPSLDELSDVCFSIARVVGGAFGILYVPFPMIGRHIKKMDKRMAEYGCVRSANHKRCQGGT